MKSKRSGDLIAKEGFLDKTSALLNRKANRPITLLTDFGTTDYYVGSVKGVILSINPAAAIIDLTHNISPQDIEAAAFTIFACYRLFPAGTIHVSVVDPGVGSSRRPILVSAGEQFFVGPDNGIFSYVLNRETESQVTHITAKHYFRQPLSNTFHARDVFAPVAAAVSTGVSPRLLGPEINDPVLLPSLKPEILKNANVKGRIIHVDHFGNCVTNIDRSLLGKEEVSATLIVNGKTVKSFRQFYGEQQAKTLFAIWGSAGFLEISAQNRSAAKILKAKRGDSVVLRVTTNA